MFKVLGVLPVCHAAETPVKTDLYWFLCSFPPFQSTGHLHCQAPTGQSKGRFKSNINAFNYPDILQEKYPSNLIWHILSHCTCILFIFSDISCLCRSLSPSLTCSSWSWVSAFLRRCSESPLLCVRAFNSICTSFHSLSRACLAFSTDALFCSAVNRSYHWLDVYQLSAAFFFFL